MYGVMMNFCSSWGVWPLREWHDHIFMWSWFKLWNRMFHVVPCSPPHLTLTFSNAYHFSYLHMPQIVKVTYLSWTMTPDPFTVDLAMTTSTWQDHCKQCWTTLIGNPSICDIRFGPGHGHDLGVHHFSITTRPFHWCGLGVIVSC